MLSISSECLSWTTHNVSCISKHTASVGVLVVFILHKQWLCSNWVSFIGLQNVVYNLWNDFWTWCHTPWNVVMTLFCLLWFHVAQNENENENENGGGGQLLISFSSVCSVCPQPLNSDFGDLKMWRFSCKHTGKKMFSLLTVEWNVFLVYFNFLLIIHQLWFFKVGSVSENWNWKWKHP